MSKKQIIYLLSVFALLLIGRISIAGTGYLEDTDELLYIWIHLHFADFTHLSTWSHCMFRVQGQPPEILIRLMEYICLLPIAASMGKSMLHPDILYFMGLFNIVVSLLILYVFFRILLKLKFSFEYALTGVVLLGTLFNYNMYTRHILPYDHALLFQLLALNILLGDNVGYRKIMLAGLFSAIGLTNYLGCFMFMFINFGYLLLSNYKMPKVALMKALFFVLPFLILILCYQALTLADEKSYLSFLGEYSDTVNSGGSFDEGLIYVFLYFYLVEKCWGILLLLLSFAGGYLLFLNINFSKARLVLFLGLIAYLTFGVYVYFFHKMLFSGRVLHIYYPFVIIGVLGLLQQQKILKPAYMIAGIVFFAFISYAFVIKDFNRIGYPRNAIYKYGLFEQKGKVHFSYFEEMYSPMHYSDRANFYIDSTGPTILPSGHYAVGNLGFLVDVPDTLYKYYQPWKKADKDSVVFEQLHFESHPAYTLEYCTRLGRNFYLEKKLKIRVVKIQDP